MVDLGFVPGEGTGSSVVVLDEVINVFPELSDAGEARGLHDWPPRIENQHSTWLSQEAWVGVKWK